MTFPSLTPDLWFDAFPVPQPAGNKYDRGHAVVLGGPLASTGAAKIAARNALRIGAGLVSIACDAEALSAYAIELEAVMTKPVADVRAFNTLIADPRVTAVLLGPGAGLTSRTRDYVLATLTHKKPAVLDADVFTVFARHPTDLFSAIHTPTVLTPHEGEFARLFDSIVDMTHDRATQALAAAKLSKAVIVLKGSQTVVAAPDGRYAVNPEASPYLATAGSGDALAGMVTGLLAQSMPAYEAACAAVWLHAEVAKQFGAGLIAEDIADGLPTVLKRVLKN